MAKIVSSTSTPSPPPSRRRTMLAAASAVIMGGGISAGVAASVADLVPDEPDADLIALCAEFNSIERRHYQVFIAESRGGDEDAAEAAMDAMREEHEPLLAQITALAPMTIEGAIALAASLQGWSHGDFADSGGTDDWLARTLIEGLARLSPDAHLLRFKHNNAGGV